MATATLVGAFAVFYPKHSETEPKPGKTEQAEAISTGAAGDFCSLLNQCIQDIPNGFEQIKGAKSDEYENADFKQKTFYSKIQLPNTSSCTINIYLLKNGNLSHDFTSIISSTSEKIDAELAYQQMSRKLATCLRDYVNEDNGIKDEDVLKSTAYRLNGAEITLELSEDKENKIYAVDLVVQSFE